MLPSIGERPWHEEPFALTADMMTRDDDAMRTIVELPDTQLKALARLCRKEGISRAEAIRRAVDKLVGSDQASDEQEDLRAAFGLWRGRQPNGRAYVENLRAEWEDGRASGEVTPV